MQKLFAYLQICLVKVWKKGLVRCDILHIFYVQVHIIYCQGSAP